MIKQIVYGCCLLLCACSGDRKEIMQSMKEHNLIQEKTVNDYVFRLHYMPQEEISEDTALLYFRLNVSNTSGVSVKEPRGVALSYGLDTLFSIVKNTDTISPVDISRIVNGTINGTEYMLVFDKQKIYSQQDCKLLFKDWLFTQQFISFPMPGKVIAHIDSLSLNL